MRQLSSASPSGSGPRAPTVTGAVFEVLQSADPHRPRVTVYAEGGARTELSTRTLVNLSAKVAGLLTDELGASPGDTVFVDLPPGWQTAAVLLGTWWAGLAVTDVDSADAVAAFVPDGADPGVGAADEVFVVSGHPLGAPSRQVAAHQRDFTGAVLGQADRFSAPPVGAGLPAVAGSADLTVEQVLELTTGRWQPGVRLLSTASWTLPHPGLDALVAPLLAGGSVVQVIADAGDPAGVEKTTAVLR